MDSMTYNPSYGGDVFRWYVALDLCIFVDLDELFKQAKENPVKGPLFTVEHEGKTINISIK